MEGELMHMHPWMFRTEKDSGDYIYIPKCDRDKVKCYEDSVVNNEELKAVDLISLCKSLRLEVTESNMSKICYGLDDQL